MKWTLKCKAVVLLHYFPLLRFYWHSLSYITVFLAKEWWNENKVIATYIMKKKTMSKHFARNLTDYLQSFL